MSGTALKSIGHAEIKEYAEALVQRGADPLLFALAHSWLLYDAALTRRTSEETTADLLERVKRECSLVYGELNKALGSHAPKAWDRIKEALDG